MGWQIIKQPNGKFCIFSSVVDNVIYYNATKGEVINAFVEAETVQIKKRVNNILQELEEGEKPYAQFTKNFDDMIKSIKRHHGQAEGEKVLKRIGNTKPKTDI